MDNIENRNSMPMMTKTIKDNDNSSTALIIYKEYVRELQIENSKVSMSIKDLDGNKNLLVYKACTEIVID